MLKKKQDLQTNPTHCQSSQQVLKISVIPKQVIRTTVESFSPEVCTISSTGYTESPRQPQDGYFKIGRQQITESGTRPNDLMLPPSDRAISRSHCMINYEAFFNKSSPSTWISFLMILHPKLGDQSFWKYLPIEIFKYIISFLRYPRTPLIIDLGSMCGTYVKVSSTLPIILEQGVNLLVGSDINIEVDRVENKGCEIESDDIQIDGNNTITGFSMNTIPFVLLKVSKAFPDNEATTTIQTYKFEAREEKHRFSIGRSQSCDINLPENTISRVQCRVLYEEKMWKLVDGSEGKPTVNGTWLSISKRNNVNRESSDPFALTNGGQIKISDTILEVTWN